MVLEPPPHLRRPSAEPEMLPPHLRGGGGSGAYGGHVNGGGGGEGYGGGGEGAGGGGAGEVDWDRETMQQVLQPPQRRPMAANSPSQRAYGGGGGGGAGMQVRESGPLQCMNVYGPAVDARHCCSWPNSPQPL